jgi:hypothetical protein
MLGKRIAKLQCGVHIPASKGSKVRSLFGRLELRYKRTRCHARLGSFVTVTRYGAVAKDFSSVAVVSVNPIAGKQISHIHFEGDYLEEVRAFLASGALGHG